MWIDKTTIKSILGITVTTWDTRIDSLIQPLKDWVIGYLHNDFEVQRKIPERYYPIDERFNYRHNIYLFTNTISFDAATNEIRDSGNNFVNAGFVAGFDIKVSDSSYNDKIFTISTVTAGVITLSTLDTLTDETAGNYCYLSMVKLPEGLKMPFSKLIDIELHKMNVASINVEAKVSGNYPPEIIEQLKPWKRAVFI